MGKTKINQLRKHTLILRAFCRIMEPSEFNDLIIQTKEFDKFSNDLFRSQLIWDLTLFRDE